MFLYTLIGLINIVLFGLMVLFIAKRSKWFTLKKYTISHLATDERNGPKFNFILFLFSLGQVIFSFEVCRYYSISGNSFPLLAFIIGGVFLCLASVFSLKNYPGVHSITAFLSASFVGLGVLLLIFTILRQNPILGITLLIATMLIPISFILRNKLIFLK